MQCYSLYGMCKKYLETVVLVLTSMVTGMEFHSEGGEIQCLCTPINPPQTIFWYSLRLFEAEPSKIGHTFTEKVFFI